eukprot:GHVR01074499.1.p1 GENE.GHVR01074499.1~~GHVR01074499.1.p1  ORF type:complete len:113 (+),score=2.66 GHVR01074499.1:83-421(+)
MRKLLKFLGIFLAVVFLVIWVGEAILRTYETDTRLIEQYEKSNPDLKVKYIASDLSFFDVLFTKDHEWDAVWEVDGKRKRVRWSREYNQPVPLGVYFGMGTSFLSFVEMRNK